MRRSAPCSPPLPPPSEIPDLHRGGPLTLAPSSSPGKGKPPPPLFPALLKTLLTGVGDDEDPDTAGRSLRTTPDLSIGALENTGHATYEILLSLAERHDEGVYWSALLKIDGEGLVLVLQSLFYIDVREE